MMEGLHIRASTDTRSNLLSVCLILCVEGRFLKEATVCSIEHPKPSSNASLFASY